MFHHCARYLISPWSVGVHIYKQSLNEMTGSNFNLFGQIWNIKETEIGKTLNKTCHLLNTSKLSSQNFNILVFSVRICPVLSCFFLLFFSFFSFSCFVFNKNVVGSLCSRNMFNNFVINTYNSHIPHLKPSNFIHVFIQN